MNPITFVVTKKVSFAGEHKSRRSKPPDEAPEPRLVGRTPRIARLMALAIHYDQLLRAGVVNNQAEIAMLCHVTRARVDTDHEHATPCPRHPGGDLAAAADGVRPRPVARAAYPTGGPRGRMAPAAVTLEGPS